jgi:hypothetical protein
MAVPGPADHRRIPVVTWRMRIADPNGATESAEAQVLERLDLDFPKCDVPAFAVR